MNQFQLAAEPLWFWTIWGGCYIILVYQAFPPLSMQSSNWTEISKQAKVENETFKKSTFSPLVQFVISLKLCSCR